MLLLHFLQLAASLSLEAVELRLTHEAQQGILQLIDPVVDLVFEVD